jgi:hypothetical protein
VQIDFDSETLGNLQFPSRLGAASTAYGFRIDLPAELRLWKTGGLGLPAVVRNLQLVLSVVKSDGGEVELGTLSSDGIYVGSNERYPTGLSFTWMAPVSVLVEYERMRNGNPPRFRARIYGDIALQIPGPRPGLETLTIPRRFFGVDELQYSSEDWATALRSLRFNDIVQLELPLASTPPGGFDGVWHQIRTAREVFLRGGPFAWESCAVSVRQALEAWERLEAGNREQRPEGTHATKRSRLHGLRKQLHYYVGYAAHGQEPSEPEWTREDALLVLTTLCALLSARRP